MHLTLNNLERGSHDNNIVIWFILQDRNFEKDKMLLATFLFATTVVLVYARFVPRKKQMQFVHPPRWIQPLDFNQKKLHEFAQTRRLDHRKEALLLRLTTLFEHITSILMNTNTTISLRGWVPKYCESSSLAREHESSPWNGAKTTQGVSWQRVKSMAALYKEPFKRQSVSPWLK